MIFRKEKGLVLPAVIAIVVIFAIVGMTVLTLAEQEVVLGRVEADRAKAFYLAEAGLAKMQEKLMTYQALGESVGDETIVLQEELESGAYTVALDANQTPCYAVATGTSGNITKTIRAEAAFLAPPLEHAVYAMNITGIDWAFQLRGTGNPVSTGWFGAESGGKDQINGNIFVDGDAYLFEESSVNAAPAPNPFGLNGDLETTGDITIEDDAEVAGNSAPNSERPDIVDLTAMDYEHNNTHNVAQIFANEGINSGYLPSGNELRDVFVKNPGDRSAECGTTSGDDFFFEPTSGFVTGSSKTGDTPLNAGENRVYYVDGDVWIHSYPTYGFKMEGKVTIVATGDIHVCDNLEYADDDSILGLVALGKYDGDGDLVSGGNIRFGDAVYGNMGMFSAMMFAANDFTFNTDQITNRAAEPDSGFTINGNFAAMGRVEIERDWYDKRSGWTVEKRAAHYDPQIQKWVDSETLTLLNTTEQGSLRHYQMIVNYDDRVRNTGTQPPGLPRGGIKIFAGFTNWQEN